MSTLQNIVDEVRLQLNDGDSANYRWSDADLLIYCNAAQRQIVQFVPEANIIEALTTITADSDVRQTIPADGIKFIKVAAAHDNTNTQRGPAITQIEFDTLDHAFPDWQYGRTEWPRTPNITDIHSGLYFEHYMHDPREPLVYYLYPIPPTTGTIKIYLVYCQLPADATALSDTYALGDEYQNAAVEYIQYRALSKDGRYGGGKDLRLEMWNNFRRALGLKIEQEARVGPSASKPPDGP